VIRTRPLLGALITATVAAFMLAVYGGSSEGTVVTKTPRPWAARRDVLCRDATGLPRPGPPTLKGSVTSMSSGWAVRSCCG
jgi:hypothetical protein